MGLMDSLLGAAQQALSGQQAAGGGSDWVGMVSGLLNQQGGLAGILQQLQAGGLGEQVQSWIGTGANLPVSADQLSAALGGSDALSQLASQAGVSHAEAGAQLSQWLPQIVDKLSPNGQLPDSGDLGAMLGQLLGR
ncbi:YidB family protein [Paucibacter sediminis]|uniref:YidB family protein n=1 Tax=Paucibacter sediminis TaxID=3019553 RepID=A0AA95NA79_9BURK|nr:YidB family protein [Paucibacter sp. S2-9]WIT11505.1 YidB family protein [Paucibacter sp. S2-9]